MTQDGGGWTVFQRRVDNTTDFYRNYANYTEGFGDLEGNFWAGLDHLHALTSISDTELHIYMDTFDNETYVARYSKFAIGNEASAYEFFAEGYRGNAGDALVGTDRASRSALGMVFTTKDVDNDLSNENCAQKYTGAWWYNSCHAANLNGRYLGGNHASYADGMNWNPARGYQYSMKTTIMQLRRVN